MKKSKLGDITKLNFIFILSLIISSYLVFIHYSGDSSFCDFAPSLSCDIVNRSRYSEFPPGNGIPVSAMGLFAFAVMLFILNLIKENFSFKIGKTKINRKNLLNILIGLLIISLLFSAYLVFTELFLILSVCILCTILDLLLILALYYSFKLKREL